MTSRVQFSKKKSLLVILKGLGAKPDSKRLVTAAGLEAGSNNSTCES
jgi:hypothetical protein